MIYHFRRHLQTKKKGNKNMNSILITGRLCQSPELRTTETGKNVMNINVAVKRPKTKDVTDFFTVILWEQNADFIYRYAQKGDKVGVIGKLTTRKYEDKNGNKRTAFEIVADNIEILASGSGLNENAPISDATTSIDGNDVEFEELGDSDELPF